MEQEIIKVYINIISRCEVPHSFYSFKGYKEESCCLEKKENSWIVYLAERGNKYNMTKHESLIDAIRTMTNQLAASDEQEELINSVFEREECVTKYINEFYKNIKVKRLVPKKDINLI